MRMSLEFTRENAERIRQIVLQYPDSHAGILPALAIAQEQFGVIEPQVMQLVAQSLAVPAEHVVSAATFYTMYNKRPVGKYHIQVCGNVSCWLRGANDVVDAIRRELKLQQGETTPDGLFTLTLVQCLASCGTAPALQINDTYYEAMTPEKIVSVLRRLREEQKPA